MTVFYNVNRAADAPPLRAADVLPLPGDELVADGPALTAEEIEAEFARVSALDADLL